MGAIAFIISFVNTADILSIFLIYIYKIDFISQLEDSF